MYTLLVILICIAAILMIGIVLIQESKGGGLSSSFASYNQIGGVRKTTDFVEKATWGLAAFMIVISIFCTWKAPDAANEGSVMEGIELPATNANNLPGFGAGQPAAETTAPATEAAAPAAEAPAETPAE